jgi:hypothetical protein
MLEDAVDTFTEDLRSYGEPRLAAALEGAKEGDPDRLPQRVLSLFTHGMGELLDVPLFKDGALNRPGIDGGSGGRR